MRDRKQSKLRRTRQIIRRVVLILLLVVLFIGMIILKDRIPEIVLGLAGNIEVEMEERKEEAAKQKAEEEAAKQRAEEEAEKQKAEEEAAKQKAEEEAAKQEAEDADGNQQTSDVLIVDEVDFQSVQKAGSAVVKQALPELKKLGIPKSLINLARRNPESLSFVRNYPKFKNNTGTIDISGDMQETDGLPLFIQWDERWGYRKYGGRFMAVTGCGPTCLSMVRCGLGKDGEWNPWKVAKLAEEKGYYVKGSGSSWSLMQSGASLIGLKGKEVRFSEEAVRKELKNGRPVICAVGEGDFTDGGHFIVLTGISKSGAIRVNDPYSKLRSKKTWKLSRIMNQAKNLWSYTLKD